MLYISLSDTAIEVIQTHKSLLGAEHIVSSARKEIEAGLIENGAITDLDKFLMEWQEIITTAYPKPIKDNQVALLISDSLVYIDRLHIAATDGKDLPKIIVAEAGARTGATASELEHFFKPLADTAGTTPILYTSMPKTSIVYYADVMKKIGLQMIFLASNSFALYEIVKFAIGSNQHVLFAGLDKKTLEMTLYDKLGPLQSHVRHVRKHIQVELAEGVKEMTQAAKVNSVDKIIISGEGSIELHAAELSTAWGVQVIKLSDLIGEILTHVHVDIDTGGIPKMLYANPIALYLLGKNPSAPNYARDLDLLGGLDPILSIPKANKTKEDTLQFVSKETSRTQPSKDELFFDPEDDVVEYEKSGFAGFLMKALLVLGILLLLGGAGFGGYMYLQKSGTNISLPFISQPTSTPTPSPSPTITPTPTIDPKLKRSDIKVTVQNGTEKGGYAREIADFLEDKGYRSVGRGNADKNDYANTVIKIKEDKKQYMQLIKEDLKEKFSAPTEETLDEDDSSDAIVILGNK